MINLYIFNESSPAAVYGIGTYTRELYMALKDSNINICIIQLYSDKQDMISEESGEIRNWYVPSPINQNTSLNWSQQSKMYYRNVVYLLRLQIKDTHKLIFHFNYMQEGMLAKELRSAFSCRVILTIHYLNWCLSLSGNSTRALFDHQDNLSRESIIKKELIEEKKFFNLTDKIICLSEFTQDILRTDYGIMTAQLYTVYNGLPNNNTHICKNLLRKKYRLPVKAPFILFVGRLNNFKGLKYVLRAFRIVLEKLPSCRMLIVGNGSYDSYLKECEDIWANVIFTGRLEKNKLYDLYSIVDIGVLPSFTEQCSYVAIEMMMHGLPMITTAAPGLTEMTEDGISSLQVPIIEHPDRMEIDPDLLAEKMLYLLEHPAEAKQLGKNARKRYEERYSGEIFRNNMLNFYHSLYE